MYETKAYVMKLRLHEVRTFDILLVRCVGRNYSAGGYLK